MNAQDIDIKLIQKTELFSKLPQNEIDFVVSRSGTLKLKKGAVLFCSGEEARRFYILRSGIIRVFKKKDDDGEDEMARFAPGDTIGDFDFARGAEYDATAEAAEDSELIEFPGYDLTMGGLTQEEPKIVCNILLSGIIMMTGRIKATHKLVLNNLSWVQDLHRRAYEDAGTGLWKQTLIADEIKDKLNDPSALIMVKPDRFKILVDSRGHSAGDEAMIRIAIILKNITRIHAPNGDGWALRFKSNETGLIFNNCDAEEAEKITVFLSEAIADMEPVAAKDDIPEFNFSATISWCLWNKGCDWDTLFAGNYANLLETWKSTGNTIVRYAKQE